MGDAISVSLSPEEAYGHRDERQIRNVPLRKLPAGKVQVGMQYQITTGSVLNPLTLPSLREFRCPAGL